MYSSIGTSTPQTSLQHCEPRLRFYSHAAIEKPVRTGATRVKRSCRYQSDPLLSRSDQIPLVKPSSSWRCPFSNLLRGIALLCSTGFTISAVNAQSLPILATDWMPLIDGATYRFQNRNTISTQSGLVTVKGNQIFNGQNVFTWTFNGTCATTMPVPPRSSESTNQGCLKQLVRHYRHEADGLHEHGRIRQYQLYGPSGSGIETFSYSYAGPLGTASLWNRGGAGDAARSSLPFEIPLYSGNFFYFNWNWGPVTVYRRGSDGTNDQVTVAQEGYVSQLWSGYKLPSLTWPTGSASSSGPGGSSGMDVLQTVEWTANPGASWAPTQLRTTVASYGRGLGIVHFTDGDVDRYTNTREQFYMTGHNFPGCFGFDPSLPALPAGSVVPNNCLKGYTGIGKTAVEYYLAERDTYFLTADAGEQAFVDSGGAGAWRRTGRSFPVGGTQAVCRFYGNSATNPATTQVYGPRSHFYTIFPAECEALKQRFQPNEASWKFESNDFFAIPLGVDGSCPAGTQTVFRAYNNGYPTKDSNHRYSTDRSVFRSMGSGSASGGQASLGNWTDEGPAFCVPFAS